MSDERRGNGWSLNSCTSTLKRSNQNRFPPGLLRRNQSERRLCLLLPAGAKLFFLPDVHTHTHTHNVVVSDPSGNNFPAPPPPPAGSRERNRLRLMNGQRVKCVQVALK